MRIGLNSLIGDGFGNGSFSFGEVPSGGGGFPAYGTFLYTDFGIVYPQAQGGAYYEAADDTENQLPIQNCDVDVKADGAGGSFIDWTTVTNVVYFTYGTFIVSENIPSEEEAVEVPTESGNYYDSGTYDYRNAYSDANGGVYYEPDTSSTFTLYPYGTLIFNDGPNTTYYKWDGDGSYYTEYYGE